MTDRVVILFAQSGRDVAAVRRRWGAGVVRTELAMFFAAEDRNALHDDRFHDAECLATRYVVWASPLQGNGIGVVSLDEREDVTVRVHCDHRGRHPTVEDLGAPTPPAPKLCGKCGRVSVADPDATQRVQGHFCKACISGCYDSELADHRCAIERWDDRQRPRRSR